MTSTPKWEEVFNKKFGSRMDTLCRKYVKEALSVTDIKSFIRSTRDEAYVEGYKAGGGDLGKRVGAEYVGFQEKIDEAVRETRQEILATFDEMVTLRPKEAERSDIITFRDWLRRRVE